MFFHFQIDKWLDLYEKCENIESYYVICNWLLIDQRLLKFRILNECSKWANIFKEYLYQSVIERMNVSGI